MEKLEVTFRIVTPLFLGGANQQRAELRAPSVKGALRFWWRALNWYKFAPHTASQSTMDKALTKLKEEESRIFGSASADSGLSGSGLFQLYVRWNQKLASTRAGIVHPKLKPQKIKNVRGRREVDQNHLAGARYLGYGLMVPFSTRSGKQAGQLERGCLESGQPFSVHLAFRNGVESGVVQALKLFGLLGGLGSRSRHGYGSVTLEKIEKDGESYWKAPADREGYIREVKGLLGKCTKAVEPDYSAFSQKSRVDILLEGPNPYDVLDQFGLSMLDYRSWGRTNNNGTRQPLPSGNQSEERFKDDHHWYRKKDWRSKHPDFHPERIVFGLPHNYAKQDEHHVTPVEHERRAAPLLFHVHRLDNFNYLGVTIFLQSLFLPDNEKINAGGKCVKQKINWAIITDFLDGKKHKPATGNRFPEKEQILP